MNQTLLSTLIKNFFQHQMEIKMFHFQTKNYGAHKASDMYLSNFLSNMDKFLEAAQGISGQTKLKNIEVKFNTLTDKTIIQALEQFINLLFKLDESLGLNKDLLAIRDEMMADANQLKYLLIFE